MEREAALPHVKPCGGQGWIYTLQSGSMGGSEIHSSTVEEFSRVLLSRGRKEQNRLFSVVHEQCLQCGLTTPRGEAAESTNGQRG